MDAIDTGGAGDPAAADQVRGDSYRLISNIRGDSYYSTILATSERVLELVSRERVEWSAGPTVSSASRLDQPAASGPERN